eukprot:g5706.t1
MRRTQYPIVTGTSVCAVKYNGGVMMVADTLGSYGSLARFKDLRRIKAVGESTLIGAGGEFSDFQEIGDMLNKLVVRDKVADDGCKIKANEIHSYLTRVMYQRRNKFNPLFNTIVVAGFSGGESFLGMVDSIGTAFTEDFVATGFGGHLAIPIMREEWRPDVSEDEARALLEKCMRVLYYRDCRTINKMTFSTVSAGGPQVKEPEHLDTKWDYEGFVNPKAGGDTGGSW